MAITYDNKASNLVSGSSISFSYTCGSDSDRLLVAIFCIRDTGVSVQNYPTYGGVNLSKANHADNADGERTEIWYLKAPASGANTFSATLSSSADCRTYLASFENIDQTTPYDKNTPTTGSSGYYTQSITPTNANALIVVGATSEDSDAPNAGGGLTSLYLTDEGTWSTGSGYIIKTDGTSSTPTLGSTTWDDYYAGVVAVFNPLLATTYNQNNSAVALIVGTVTKGNNAKASITRNYSWGDEASLPTTDADLDVYYSDTDEDTASTDDGGRVTAYGNSGYVIHQFKDQSDSALKTISVSWNGQASIACSSKTVYLQIYDRNLGSWETLDSDTTTAANTDFTLEGSKTSSLSDYYDSDNKISCRIYQAD